RTSQVLQHVADAEAAGASGLLLAPVSYQALTDADVFELYRAVSEHSQLPIIVYDNPGTTHFTFTIELYARLAELPTVAAIKIPPVPADVEAARQRVGLIRDAIPLDVSIGVSGDAFAATGLVAGCDAWFSAIGGTLPQQALEITRAVQRGDAATAFAASRTLDP